MSLGKAKWITIDEFVSVVEEYGVDVSMIQLWIDNKELTVKYSDDLFVLTDYKYNSLLYKILSGNITTRHVEYRIGKHFKTINRNVIRVHNKKYIVYTVDGTIHTFRKADRAIQYANSLDKHVSSSSDSRIVRLNKQDINKLKSMFKIVGYQGKINNKLNNTLRKINARDNNRNNAAHNRCNSDTDNSDTSKVPTKHKRANNKKTTNIHNDSNIGGNNTMEQVGRKKRNIKVSKQTKEYISNKYNIPVNKLTYIFNYTRDTNLQAMEIISDAINYENNVVAKKLNELSEVVYGVPN